MKEQIKRAHCVQSELNKKRSLLHVNYRDGEKDYTHSCRKRKWLENKRTKLSWPQADFSPGHNGAMATEI